MTAYEPLLAVGNWVSYRNKRLRVIEGRVDGVVLYERDDREGRTAFMTFLAIRAAAKQGTLKFLGKVPTGEKKTSKSLEDLVATPVGGWDIKATKEMIRRRTYCQACETLFAANEGEPGWARRPEAGYSKIAEITAEQIHEEKAAKLGNPAREIAFVRAPSGSTLRGWHRKWLDAGKNQDVLYPRHDLKGGTDDRLPQEVKKIILEEIRKHFLIQERPSLAAFYEVVAGEIQTKIRKRQATNTAIPNIDTIRRFILRNISSYEADLRRLGPEAAIKHFVRGKPLPSGALDEVEIDHTPLDVYVILKPGDYGYDPAIRNKPVRPYLTLAIDVATRMAFGFHIGLAAPSWASVMDCLLHGIRPKTLEGTHPDAVWPVEGVPVLVRSDRAKEFLSEAGDRTVARLDMAMTQCAKAMPDDKPYIERFIGTVNENFTAFLAGKSFSNPKERGEYKAPKLATLTLAELRRLFLIWVVDVYHNKPHGGVNMYDGTPLNMWRDRSRRMRPSVPMDDDELIASLCYPIGTKLTKIPDEGIKTEGLRFQSLELKKLQQRLACYCKPMPEICLDPRDLTAILVRNIDGRWMRVPADASNDPASRELNLAQWREYRQNRKTALAPTEAQNEARRSGAKKLASASRHTHVPGSSDLSSKNTFIEPDPSQEAYFD